MLTIYIIYLITRKPSENTFQRSFQRNILLRLKKNLSPHLRMTSDVEDSFSMIIVYEQTANSLGKILSLISRSLTDQPNGDSRAA